MNIKKALTKVAGLFKGKAISTPGWEPLYGILQQTGWAAPPSQVLYPLSIMEQEQAFGGHPIVKACAEVIATTLSKPRLEVGAWMGDEWVPAKSNPMLDLLGFPNPEYSRQVLFELMVTRAALTGFSYIQIIENMAGTMPVQLWPFPTSWVKPIPAPAGSDVIYSGYKVNGQRNLIPRENMIVLRKIDPASMAGGIGAMDSAYKEYRLDQERTDYQAEALENLKIPGLVITPKTMYTSQQRADLKADIESKFGRGNRFRVMILEGPDGATVTALNPLGDLDWPGMTGLSETRICASFGVPPIIIHSRFGLEKATYSNYELAKKAFYEISMTAWWSAVANALTFGLFLKRNITGLEFRFRWDLLPEFQEDRTALSQRTVSEFEKGILSREEARAILGYEPDPDNDVIVVPSGGSGEGEDGGDGQGNQGNQSSDEESDAEDSAEEDGGGKSAGGNGSHPGRIIRSLW